MPALGGRDASGKELEEFRAAIKGTRVGHLRAAASVRNDGFVTVNNGVLVVRERIDFMPSKAMLTMEQHYQGCRANGVRLNCWISIHPSVPRDQVLPRGNWHNEEGTIGVTITADPSKNDLTRLKLDVRAPSITEARIALAQTLEGEKVASSVWKA